MTGFRVCPRVCHHAGIAGEVRGAFNQAPEERAEGALLLSCLCGGWAAIRTLPFFCCYDNL